MDTTLTVPSAAASTHERTGEQPLTPISSGERLFSVDVLRGFAVLGILLMNIVGFALHAAAYTDPTVAGGATGVNWWVYAINAVLVDGKMRGIFSLMFGAGVWILTSRAEARGHAADAADIHYRRMYWLMLFGIVHAYLLWWGEILYPYALLGLLLYPMRKLSVRGLVIAGTVFAILVTLAFGGGNMFRMQSMQAEAAAADQAQARGERLTDEQIEAQRAWRENLKHVKPDAAELTRVNNAFGGSFMALMKERAKLVAAFHFTPYYFPMLWDMLCMMLFGMAMAKAGVLSGERPYGYYVRMAAIGYAIGIPLHLWILQQSVAVDFEVVGLARALVPYEVARIAVCFAHVAAIIMIVKAGVLRGLTARLAAVGQTAFSNYILQSLICSTIFYGYGFGLFGQLQRYEIYYVVALCWVIALVASPLWLKYYRFGPLEWGWRSLTYWKRQPMRVIA